MITRSWAGGAVVVGGIGMALLLGCAGRKVGSAVEDQAFLAPPAPAAEAQAPASRPAEAGRIAPAPPTALKEAPPAEARRQETARVESVPVPPAGIPPATIRAPVTDFSDGYFDYDQFTIRNDARTALETDARILKSTPDRAVLIEGHCDERGTMAYNLVLGERRAKAAQRYLEDLGVMPSQLQITSYGKERPFCTEHSEACWQSNRRAHFSPR